MTSLQKKEEGKKGGTKHYWRFVVSAVCDWNVLVRKVVDKKARPNKWLALLSAKCSEQNRQVTKDIHKVSDIRHEVPTTDKCSALQKKR